MNVARSNTLAVADVRGSNASGTASEGCAAEQAAPDDLPALMTLGEVSTTSGALANQHQLIALLAYLAHEGPTDRQTIARLFWPDGRASLNSLSSALTRIRRAVPGAVQADRHTISTACTTDGLSFLQALADGRHDAYRQHPGLFLAGFHIKSIGIELEEWIFDTREALADAAASNAIAEAKRLDTAGDVQGAAASAQWAVETAITPGALIPEAGWLRDVLQRAQNPAAYRLVQFVREAGRDDGLTLQAQELSPERSTGDRATPAGCLHGRSADLSRVHAAFASHRIVNMFGMGGVGKTRLARAFAASAPNVAGVKLIEICRSDEADCERLWKAIADAAFRGAPRTASAIPDRLEQDCLVVVDSVAATDSVVEVLTQLADVGGLQVLVLSRQRLIGHGIKSIPVRGLRVDEPTGIGPAVRLLRECAGADLIARIGEERFHAHARDVCIAVSGVPLAIELMAAWLRVVPIDEIAGILADQVLDATPPGTETSPSLVVERAWDLLPDALQKSLMALSVFESSFDRAAAMQVADVNLQVLSDLHDYSLIEIGDDGRLRCQLLVRAFARRQLADSPSGRCSPADRHRDVYLPVLIDAESTEQAFRSDQPNIAAALSHCLETADPRALAALGGFHRLALRSGQVLAAKSLYEDSLARLVDRQSPERCSLAAAVTGNLAWVNMLLGNAEETKALCEHGFALLGPDDVRTHIMLLRTCCALAGNDGDVATALAGYEDARSLAVDLDDVRLCALLDEDVGRSQALLGDHEQAIAAFRRTLDAGRNLDDPHMEARSLFLLGISYVAGDPDRSFVLFDEGERLARENKLRRLEAYFPVERAFARLFHGMHLDAIAEFTRAVDISTENGDQALLVRCQLGLARALLRAEKRDAGLAELRSGLRAAVRADLWAPALGAALDIVDMIREIGPDTERLRGLHWFALNHPKAPEADRRLFATESSSDESPPQFAEPTRLDELCEVVQAAAAPLITDT